MTNTKFKDNLWVVMPVYNEQEALPQVVADWLPELRKQCENVTLLLINDGSKDNTAQILDRLKEENDEIKVIHKTNSGHGQSCVYGYKEALKNGAEWVFQIDSDGQCSPAYFQKVIEQTSQNKVVYGYRKSRDDGFQRFMVSRIVSVFVMLATGVWVADANVPYRFMHRSALENILPKLPTNFYLTNILISTLQQKQVGIKWVDIHFLDRQGGTPSVSNSVFAKHGITLFKQLRNYFKSI